MYLCSPQTLPNDKTNKRVSGQLHTHAEMKIVNVCSCFLVRWHFSTEITIVGFLDLRRNSSSLELKSFLPSMCTDAPESTSNARSSGFFGRGCGHYRGFAKRIERIFSSFFEPIDTFLQVPCFSAGASLLTLGFVLRSFLECWTPRNSILKFTFLHDSLRWSLSFPNVHVTIFTQNTLSLK